MEAQGALKEMEEAEEEARELEEAEDLLEYYLQRAAATQSEAERLLAGARDLEESIGVSLSARRFEVSVLHSASSQKLTSMQIDEVPGVAAKASGERGEYVVHQDHSSSEKAPGRMVGKKRVPAPGGGGGGCRWLISLPRSTDDTVMCVALLLACLVRELLPHGPSSRGSMVGPQMIGHVHRKLCRPCVWSHAEGLSHILDVG